MILRTSEPYAVITLDEADFLPERRQRLSMSLIFAFLLSAHIRLVFPMRSSVSRDVDRVFDQALRGAPMVSKGIVYQKDLPAEEMASLLEWADFVLTSDIAIQQQMNSISKPNLLLGFGVDQTPVHQWSYLEKLNDNMLKLQIVGGTHLIQSVYHTVHQKNSIGIDLAKCFSTQLDDIHSKEKQARIEISF
jgi:hypothetical protein